MPYRTTVVPGVSVVGDDRHRHPRVMEHRVRDRPDVRPQPCMTDAPPDDDQGGVPGRLQQMVRRLPPP